MKRADQPGRRKVMIAIAGATGVVGSAIARELLRRGETVRVLVRLEEAAEVWRQRGAEAVAGDLALPNSLNQFCAGAETVITTASALLRSGADSLETVDVAGNRHLIDAAQRAGVARFILVSAAGANPGSRIPFLRAKGIAEEYLRERGAGWTIIAPHLLMETFVEMLVGVPIRAGHPVTLTGVGRALHSFVAAADVAALTVEAALRDTAGRRLVVGGSLPVSWQEIVDECRALVDTPITVRSIPPGFPFPHIAEPLGTSLAMMIGTLEERDVAIDSSPLYYEFGVEPTPLRTFLVGMLADRRRPFRDHPAAAPAPGAPFEVSSSFSSGEEPPAPAAGESETTDRPATTPRRPG
jgi:uncharacterized protein YbjT (DUF2867 family)